MTITTLCSLQIWGFVWFSLVFVVGCLVGFVGFFTCCWLGYFFPFLSYPIGLENVCVHQMGLLVFLEVYDILFYMNSYSSKVGVLRSYASLI